MTVSVSSRTRANVCVLCFCSATRTLSHIYFLVIFDVFIIIIVIYRFPLFVYLRVCTINLSMGNGTKRPRAEVNDAANRYYIHILIYTYII